MYFINSYLKGRKHKTKKKSSHSAFAEILFGVPQGSIWDHFFLEFTSLFENSDIDVANYADDNTQFACLSDLDSVIFKLQKNTERTFRLFRNNNIISNAVI